MARFNTDNKGLHTTVNHEGAVAYTQTPEMELYALVCTASLQNKFYEQSDETMSRMRSLINRVSPIFVAQLAVYAREQMYLRSIPVVLAVELARVHKGDKLVGNLVERIVQRPDEITELLAYYQFANKREGMKKLGKLSKQIQKGLARAFLKFDEYQLAKYNRGSEIKLRDALFLTHAKPTSEEQKTLFKSLVDDTLETPYTWETQLSEAGKNGKSKTEVWQELIESKKVGYMALMRNLRNILEANVSLQHIQQVAKYLADPEAVRKSKQLPFRFLSAYRVIEDIGHAHVPTLLNALEDAMLVSVENIKGYDYDTSVLIACDVSGSMDSPVSRNSTVHMYDIGIVLGMMLQNRCKSTITGIFGDIWKVKQMPNKAILQNTVALRKIGNEVGFSTNGYLVLDYLIRQNIKVDKIMMFTDCQLYGGDIVRYWSEYKKIHPKAKLYLFDLAGYGNTPLKVNEKDVYTISGWSDKVFNVLDALEKGDKALSVVTSINVPQ